MSRLMDDLDKYKDEMSMFRELNEINRKLKKTRKSSAI